jgi:pentatricopeptide repeat domain-containing protein 1
MKELLQIAKNDHKKIIEANELAKMYVEEGRISHAKEAMHCIGIFKLSGDMESAVGLIDQMNTSDLKADVMIFNNVIDGCAKAKNWETALNLLQRMHNLGLKRDIISYSSAISACAKAGRWMESVDLLKSMDKEGLTPDTICFSSVISACANKGRWREVSG